MSGERCQRPDDVIECLKLKDDDVAADLGCGAGYFSLKLAPKVAEHGSVLAEGILGEQLAFLWILHHQPTFVLFTVIPTTLICPRGGVQAVLSVHETSGYIGPYVSRTSLRWATDYP